MRSASAVAVQVVHLLKQVAVEEQVVTHLAGHLLTILAL
jgi:hypothetical protein